MSEYITKSGQVLTDETIDRMAEAYGRGEWPDGERNAGPAVRGRPPLSSDGSEVLSVKLAVGMKTGLQHLAAREGMSLSAYVRYVLARELIEAQVEASNNAVLRPTVSL